MSLQSKERQLGHHVVVVTYPAQGHINPLLQFAKRLASKGLTTTLATTHYTLNSIATKTPQSHLQIAPISDGYDASGFDQAPSLAAYLASLKAEGSRTLKDLINNLNNNTKGQQCQVKCVVYDSLLPWALDVARELGVLAAAFLTNSASVCALYWHVDRGGLRLPLERGREGVLVVPGVPPLEETERPSFVYQTVSESPYLALIMDKFGRLDENDWVFCNTFDELESQLVKAMEGLWPVQTVGPMVPSSYLDQQIEGDTTYGANLWDPTTSNAKCMAWLDTKPPNSVIYVSFGSMAHTPPKQAEELAHGLKATGMAVLWASRELPREFMEGILVVTWCDQPAVLAHVAVGCFVTHCGWNSTLEGLCLGVPMVALPLWSDQPVNAKMVEEVWGVGARVRVGAEREEVERAVREVMEGERVRRNGLKWREAAKKAVGVGGSSDRNVEAFVDVIKGKCKKN